MFCIKSLALLMFVSSTFARPNPSLAFQVTNLNTFEPTGRPGDNSPYRIGFNVTDPSNSVSTFCETRWPYAESTTGYPHNYLSNCTDSSWAFKFVEYHTYYDFVLDVKHTSKKQGKKTTRFAKGLVDNSVIQCAHAASGFSVCNQREGVEFPLKVYDVKRY